MRIADFTKGDEEPRYIDNPGVRYLVGNDDVSLVRYGACGFVYSGLEGAIANNLFQVVPKNGEITKWFLYFYLRSSIFQSVVERSASGVAMPAISFSLIKPIKIPVPPLPEQNRIVEILDTAFDAIDKAISKTATH